MVHPPARNRELQQGSGRMVANTIEIVHSPVHVHDQSRVGGLCVHVYAHVRQRFADVHPPVPFELFESAKNVHRHRKYSNPTSTFS